MAGTLARSIAAWDGEIDPGIEQRDETSDDAGAGDEVATDRQHMTSAEVVAHALLRLAAERPGHMGRDRAARIVGGFAVAYRDGEEEASYMPYVVAPDWRKRELVELVDALIDGGLVAQSVGPRPLLVLTRAGHHALNALEGTR